MILDLTKVAESKGEPELRPETLTVFEQGIQSVEWIDGTEFLNKFSYWASYNQPFSEEISKVTGRT